MSNQRVAVILATYNGEKFLKTMLSSIAQQSRRPDLLVIRDDGSVDNTVEIIVEWSHSEKIQCQWVAGTARLGPAHSFLFALTEAEPCDIYLFADQDDVWLPHKIERACGMLVTGEGSPPMLVASRAITVDHDLGNPVPMRAPRIISFSNALFENVLTGCTIAMNAKLVTLLKKKVPDYLIMHDWWCYLLATGSGVVLYDSAPSLLYRQHSGNVIGSGPSGIKLINNRLFDFFGHGHHKRSLQLKEFWSIYGSIVKPHPQRQIQQLLASTKSWYSGLFIGLTCPVQRQNFLNSISTRFAIILRRY